MRCPWESVSIGSCTTDTAVKGPPVVNCPVRQHQLLSPSRTHILVLSCQTAGVLLRQLVFLLYTQRHLLGPSRNHTRVPSCQPA